VFAVFIYLDVVGFIGRGKRIIGKGNIGMQMIGKKYRKFVRTCVRTCFKKKKEMMRAWNITIVYKSHLLGVSSSSTFFSKEVFWGFVFL